MRELGKQAQGRPPPDKETAALHATAVDNKAVQAKQEQDQETRASTSNLSLR